ncbi:MAG: twitching motility protein PilT [Methanobacteriaceae archaeon]|nr:twitching motility protein PilT [Methanobacteriaceae archaeon]
MMMIQFNIDIFYELKSLLKGQYEIIIPSIVIDELKKIQTTSKGKDKLTAKITLKIIEKRKYNIYPMIKDDHVDNILLKFTEHNGVLCTNDQKLRIRARKKNIPVIYLRQHKYLKIDGYIN